MAALPKIFDAITQLWLSEKAEIMTKATHSLDILIRDALINACSSRELVEQHKSKIERCIQTIQLGLGYQFNASWHQVLHVISTLFEVTGSHCSDMLLGLLKSLAELRDSYKFSYNNELEHAVGAAIRSMGPEVVLEVISLKVCCFYSIKKYLVTKLLFFFRNQMAILTSTDPGCCPSSKRTSNSLHWNTLSKESYPLRSSAIVDPPNWPKTTTESELIAPSYSIYNCGICFHVSVTIRRISRMVSR